MKPKEKEAAKKREKAGIKPSSKLDKGRVLERLGKMVGLSKNTLRKAIELVDTGDTKLIAKIDSGKVSISGAYQTKKKVEAEKQKIEQFKKVKDRAKARVIQGDATKLLDKIPDRSFDLLLTDPPYSTDIITIFEDRQ